MMTTATRDHSQASRLSATSMNMHTIDPHTNAFLDARPVEVLDLFELIAVFSNSCYGTGRVCSVEAVDTSGASTAPAEAQHFNPVQV